MMKITTGNYRQVQQVTITYPDSSSRSFNQSEWILYQLNNDERAILPLSDLADLYSDSVEGLAIQPISSLISIITDDYLETKKAEDTNSEKLFKGASLLCSNRRTERQQCPALENIVAA